MSKTQDGSARETTCGVFHETKPVWCSRPPGHRGVHRAKIGTITVASWPDCDCPFPESADECSIHGRTGKVSS